jgi:predicted transcriptional regulator of viral defense system
MPFMLTERKTRTPDFLRANPVFSLDQAFAAISPPGGRSGTAERLKYYREKGRIKRLARELYAVVPPGVAASRFQPDPYLVAAAVRPDGIFGYHSALELLGAAHSTWSACSVFVERRRQPIKIGSAVVRFLAFPDPFLPPNHRKLGTRQVEHGGKLLRVTGPERTLVEGFRRPALVGGPEELVRSAAGFATLDLGLLADVLKRYRSKKLWAATGWFLEQFQRTFQVPNAVLASFKRHRPRSPQYLERDVRGGTLAADWNLILPNSLQKLSEPDELKP